MSESCTPLYPFLVLAIIIVLLVGLALSEQRQIRHQRTRAFDRQNTRLLVAMLGVALMSIVIFVLYIVGPEKVC